MVVPPHKRLRACQVKPITLGRYGHAVSKFESWAVANRKPLSRKQIDRTMVEFLQHLCETGESICMARSAVFGYILFRMDSPQPERFLLTQSKEAIKGWTSRFPTHSRAAVDLAVWYVVAHKCLQTKDVNVAAAILLQGDLYLRPCERLALRKDSVLRPTASRSKAWGVVVAPQELEVPTKTGIFDDCVLLDTLENNLRVF